MVAFMCSRTGLYYPTDYIENWGKKYGIGLGKRPISEALVNDYLSDICVAKDNKQTMHPIGYCLADVTSVQIPEEEFVNNSAILAIDDTNMVERAKKMRERQILHCPHMQRRFPDEFEELKEKDKIRIAARKEVALKYKHAYLV